MHKYINSDVPYAFGRKMAYKATSAWITNTLTVEQQKIQYCANRPRQLESRKKQSADNNKPVIIPPLSFSQPNQTSTSKNSSQKHIHAKSAVQDYPGLLPQELPTS